MSLYIINNIKPQARILTTIIIKISIYVYNTLQLVDLFYSKVDILTKIIFENELYNGK